MGGEESEYGGEEEGDELDRAGEDRGQDYGGPAGFGRGQGGAEVGGEEELPESERGEEIIGIARQRNSITSLMKSGINAEMAMDCPRACEGASAVARRERESSTHSKARKVRQRNFWFHRRDT